MEQDALIEEPEPTLYGEQTRLTLENMTFSGIALSEFPEYIQSLIQVKHACALANYRAGLISEEIYHAIAGACRKGMELPPREHFPVDAFHGGGGIGINMNVNEVLSALSGGVADPIDHINLSQSTSDVCHTALRITIYRMMVRMDAVLERFCACMEEKIAAFEGIYTIARTCMQDGMPVPVNGLWRGVLASARRSKSYMVNVRSDMLRVNLGWTVVGTGTGATEGYRAHIMQALREVTGLELDWCLSPYDAAQNPDDLVRVSSEVSFFSALMCKFSKDLRLLSSGPEAGFSELKIPAVQKGSSFFPGKINPVIPEMMMQCDFLIQGNHGILGNAVEDGELHLNLWEEMMGFLLMQNIVRLTRAVALFTEKCVAGVIVNEEVCKRYASSIVPTMVKCKERYGYQETTRRIHEYGMQEVMRQLAEQESAGEKAH